MTYKLVSDAMKDHFRDSPRDADARRYEKTWTLMPSLSGMNVLDADQANKFWHNRTADFGITFLRDEDFNNGVFYRWMVPGLEVVKSSKYDYVTSFEVVEHLMNPLAYLKECHRVLKSDGNLVLTTPVAYWPPQLFLFKRHFYEMPWSRLQAVLHYAGFEVIERKKIRVLGFGPI